MRHRTFYILAQIILLLLILFTVVQLHKQYTKLTSIADWNGDDGWGAIEQSPMPVEELRRDLTYTDGVLSITDDPVKRFQPSSEVLGETAVQALSLLRSEEGKVGVDLYDRRVSLRYYPTIEKWNAYKASIIFEIDDSSGVPYIIELAGQDDNTLASFEKLISTLFPNQKDIVLLEVSKWVENPDHYQSYITMMPAGDRRINIQYNIETMSMMFKF